MICFNASFSGSKMQTFFSIPILKIHQEKQLNLLCADPEGGRGFGSPGKSQKYRVSKQYWSRSLKNLKATMPAFIVGPSSHASETSFKWRFAGEPMMAS